MYLIFLREWLGQSHNYYPLPNEREFKPMESLISLASTQPLDVALIMIKDYEDAYRKKHVKTGLAVEFTLLGVSEIREGVEKENLTALRVDYVEDLMDGLK